jgi:hypothetical protein
MVLLNLTKLGFEFQTDIEIIRSAQNVGELNSDFAVGSWESGESPAAVRNQ